MRYIFIFYILFLCFQTFAQNRYYVDQNITGSNQSGKSWADAFVDLQQAIFIATTGDTIWVAKDIYKPTSTTDRAISFWLKDGVALYGGFMSNETTSLQRNIEENKTVLSGDIGVTNLQTDNAYHVVRGKGLGGTTLFDGFYIRHGYSYNDFPPAAIHQYGAGMLLEGSAGVADSKPLIQNCYFEDNNAREGGGLCATWSDFNNQPSNLYPVNPMLRNCVFNRNTAARFGGAFYKNGSNISQDTFILEDCSFFDNMAFTGQGGGVYLKQPANSAVIIRRCLFERDSSWTNGGRGWG